MDEDHHLVLAEGKLQAGFWHDLLLGHAPSVTEREPFHFVISAGGGSELYEEVGVIYEVNAATLRNLDLLEGHPYLKRRELAAVCIGGQKMQVWVYRPLTGLDHLLQGSSSPVRARD